MILSRSKIPTSHNIAAVTKKKPIYHQNRPYFTIPPQKNPPVAKLLAQDGDLDQRQSPIYPSRSSPATKLNSSPPRPRTRELFSSPVNSPASAERYYVPENGCTRSKSMFQPPPINVTTASTASPPLKGKLEKEKYERSIYPYPMHKLLYSNLAEPQLPLLFY